MVGEEIEGAVVVEADRAVDGVEGAVAKFRRTRRHIEDRTNDS